MHSIHSSEKSGNHFSKRILNRKIFVGSIVFVLFVSFFASAIASGAVASSKTVHMTGTIVYPSPSPSPTPIPTPTSTLTPTPTSMPNQNNLAMVPDGFGIGQNWGQYAVYTSKITYPVVQGGQTAVKMYAYGSGTYYGGSAGSVDREIDTQFFDISPGDTVTFSAWFWTDSSTISDTASIHGANIELDPFNGGNRITAISNHNGVGVNYYHNGGYDWTWSSVPWGSGRWVYQTMTWKVPNLVESDGFGAYSAGTSVVPNRCTAVIQAFSSSPGSEGAAMYFYGAELYVTHP